MPKPDDIERFLPLTAREFHILFALARDSKNGYQVSQVVEETSGGRVRLSPATQFTNLHRLLEKGLIEEVLDGLGDRSDGRKQRFWTLTPLGRRVLSAEGDRLAADANLVRGLRPELGRGEPS